MAVYGLCYVAAILFAKSGHYLLSGLGLVAAAVYLYAADYRRSGNILHLRALFSLSFVGGQGLACMKFSYLSTEWNFMTWLCFLAAFAGFYAVFAWLEDAAGPVSEQLNGRSQHLLRGRMERCAGTVFFCALALTVLSVGCFVVEAAALGYIPLFVRGVPHAYSYFHLTGIHYLTVSCVLVPALSVIYFSLERGRNRGRSFILLAADAAAVAVPVLCVSRSQILFSILLAILVYVEMERSLNHVYVAAALLAIIPVYVILTVARSHDAEYLRVVFEMKRAGMPIFVAQPYMYVANNYDNFDCLVKNLAGHSFGLKMLAPLWTLTGLKFLFPSLTAFPIYVNKTEMTTLTLFYDAYYDFGLLGVLGFSCLLGTAAYFLMRLMRQAKNPAVYLLYAQFALYLLLAFFTTWFSNASTWFYVAVTAVIALLLERKKL